MANLIGLTDFKEVEKSINILKKKLDLIATENINIRYSSRAGVGKLVRASYSKGYNMWWYFDGKDDQYWNPYGINKPIEGKAITGRCQINMTKQGINRQVAGAFAKDVNGNLVLLHSGKLGGGKPGVSKEAFLTYFPGHTVEVDFKGIKIWYFVVAELQAENFYEQLKFFIQKAYDFKEAIDNDVKNIVQKGFYDKILDNGESEVKKKYRLPEKNIIANANHAIITNELLNQLNELGYYARRNRLVDTFIKDEEGHISHIFEIKSNLNTQTLYTAIGQLLIYGLKYKKAKYVLVVEKSISPKLVDDLKKIGFNCLAFGWKKKKPFIENLAAISSFI